MNTLDKWTYTVAVLNTYGVGNESKIKKIDELILSNFKSEIKPGKSEGIALCYGINRGYSAFSNRYSLGKNEKVVKFQLNSQLDYYTIESLFQYIFNNSKSNGFPYLDWCPKQKWPKISKKTDYKILDVVVIGKKKAKVSSLEYLENLLSHFFQKDSAPLFKVLFEKVREIIYNDTKEEIADDYKYEIAQKQEEIDKLKAERKELLASPKIISEKRYNQLEEKAIQTVTDSSTSYLSKQEVDIKSIVEQTLKYKEKNLTMLKNEAKNRGVELPKSIKVDEIITLLMTTPKNDLFDNE